MALQAIPADSAAQTRLSLAHLLGLSSYWFATSFKWFLLLVFILPESVAHIVPGGEKSAYWGAVFGIGATWAIVGPAIFGNLSDRSGDRRPFVIAGAILTCLSLFALFNANGLIWLGLAYLMLQVSDDLSTGPYSAVLPELVPRGQRGQASGIMSASMSLSQVAAVLTVLAMPNSKLALLALIGALNLSTAVLVTRIFNRGEPAGSERKSLVTGWREAWRDLDFRRVWATQFLVTLGFYFVVPYANFYIRDVLSSFRILGVTLPSAESATAVLALTIAIAGAAGSVASGPLIDRLGRKPVTLAGALIMAIGLVISSAILPQLTLLAGIGILFGFGYGAFQSANWAMATDVLPDPQGIGRDMGIWQMSISSVQLVAGAAGMVITLGNRWADGAGYRLLFLFAASVVSAGGLLAQRVRSTL